LPNLGLEFGDTVPLVPVNLLAPVNAVPATIGFGFDRRLLTMEKMPYRSSLDNQDVRFSPARSAVAGRDDQQHRLARTACRC